MTLDRASLKSAALAQLCAIAPEVDPDEIIPARALRSQVDLDSMDWLHFLVGLHERLGVEIPESDYARLVTLDNLLDYLQAKLA